MHWILLRKSNGTERLVRHLAERARLNEAHTELNIYVLVMSGSHTKGHGGSLESDYRVAMKKRQDKRSTTTAVVIR